MTGETYQAAVEVREAIDRQTEQLEKVAQGLALLNGQLESVIYESSIQPGKCWIRTAQR
tara:strand:- start:579 stop:755 length:177 start_codon:yes stop_codon:yes gene_type:complete